jgi:hypothetical protein
VEVTRFYQGDRHRGQWIFYSRGNDPIRAGVLVGQTVNISTNDGLVFDSARVVEFDDRSGTLTIEGGVHHGHSGDLQPTVRECVSVRDIARGYIHAGQPAGEVS